MSKFSRSLASPHSRFLLCGSVVLAIASGGLISISVDGPTLEQRQYADRQAIAKESAVQSQIIQAAKVRKTSARDDIESEITKDIARRIQSAIERGIIDGSDFIEHGPDEIKRPESSASSNLWQNSEAPEPYISVYDADKKYSFGIYLLCDKNKAEQSSTAINQ